MPNDSILVVDDNAINLKLLRVLLAGEGYSVRSAQDAEEALVILSGVDMFRPKLIFMDLQLPGMDGYELTRLLKNSEGTRDIIIIAVTSYAMKGDEEKAQGAGCDGYLSKPIDTNMLLAVVRESLAHGTYRGPEKAGSVPASWTGSP